MGEYIVLEEFPSDIPPRTAEDFTTAIDHDIAQRLITDLEQHGASVKQWDTFLYNAKLPDGKVVEKMSSNHLIHFPPGTLIHDGLRLGFSQSFRLVFPDGFVQYGLRSWMSGETKTILFLSATQQPE